MAFATDLLSENYRSLLDLIDDLRCQGLSRDVDLPVIAIYGDQSAGKSSVLNAISGLSLPTSDLLGTRFATELVLRRELTVGIKVSIRPAEQRYGEQKEILERWGHKIANETLDIGDIIERAKEVMEISPTNLYSDDVLRIELYGPNRPHLTLVDLPGMYRAGTQEQCLDQSSVVEEMVMRYMMQPRSIILAVVSANAPYVQQPVLELAKKVDPGRLRTMGLVTKPDRVEAGSEGERSWLNMVRNVDVQLKLGWHVVRNRSYEESKFTSEQRDHAERRFLSHGAWAALDRRQCGIEALIRRLGSLLGNQILQQLPDIIEDMVGEVTDCRDRLDKLGACRTTPAQKKRFLSGVSTDFSLLMTAAVQGSYHHSFFNILNGHQSFEPQISQKRLRAVVQQKLIDFAKEIREDEQQQIIVEGRKSVAEAYGNTIHRDDFVEKVRVLMIASKGRELPGLFNPMIVGDLFIAQCQPWRRLTESLSEDLLESVHETVRLIVEKTVANEVAEEILSNINESIEDLKTTFDQKIAQLLHTHDTTHAITYNPALTNRVQTMQRDRKMREVQTKIRNAFGSRSFDDPEIQIPVNPARLVDLFLEEIDTDMERIGSSMAVDYMQAYYEVALDRFVDDISNLAVEECLISQLPDLFTPKLVLEMDEAEISRLAAESSETTEERQQAEKRLTQLEDGLKKLKLLNGNRAIPRSTAKTQGTTEGSRLSKTMTEAESYEDSVEGVITAPSTPDSALRSQRADSFASA